jgi:flagellar assembly protein FliH
MRSYLSQDQLSDSRVVVQTWQPTEIASPLFPVSGSAPAGSPQQPKSTFTLAELLGGSHEQPFMPAAFKRITIQASQSEAVAEAAASVVIKDLQRGCQAWQAPELQRPALASCPERRLENALYPDGSSRFHEQVDQPEAASGMLVRAAAQKAEEILRQAQERAEELIALAESKAEDVLQQAQESAGGTLRLAYEQGWQAAKEETEAQIGVANAIVDEVREWRDNLFRQGELMMLRLVIEIAQSIFGDGLPLDPETLGQAFTRALAEARTLGDLRVYVHPEDALVLGEHWAAQQTLMSGQRIELVSSDIIKRGGCFVEGQFGSVDGRVETQFQIAKDTLLGVLAAPDGGAA